MAEFKVQSLSYKFERINCNIIGFTLQIHQIKPFINLIQLSESII